MTAKNNKNGFSAHPPTEPYKKLKSTQKHNNNPSHLHLKQHTKVPQYRIEHIVKNKNNYYIKYKITQNIVYIGK